VKILEISIWTVLIGLFSILTAIGLFFGLMFNDYTFGVLSFIFMIIILVFGQRLKQPFKTQTEITEKKEVI
jgi:hypothetical protein